jgi:pimeloyl-ACP methyl ester carboxylesterase
VLQAMARFTAADGTTLSYEDQGDGPAVLLLHGFATTARVNWGRPGVIHALVGAGYRVLTPDLRGHGRSDTPHHPEAYRWDRLVGDETGLLDHLGLEAAAIGGYSLGSSVAMLAAEADTRFIAAMLGGAGARSLAGPDAEAAETLASAMEAPRTSEVAGRGRAFRTFAEATRSDLAALAALQRALPSWPAPRPGRLRVPVLVVAGTQDTLAGPPGRLAEAFPAGQAVTVPGNHMNAMTNPAFADALVGFLSRLPGW